MNEHYGERVASNGDLHVINCKTCNYAHLENLPTQEEVDDYYKRDQFYLTHSSNDWFIKNYNEHRLGYWKPHYEYQSKKLYGKVLDYGCGDGWFIRHYHNAVGIEPSMVARSFGQFLDIYESLEKMPHNLMFDSLRMALVLEHVLKPYDLIYNLRPYMRKKHRVQIIVPNEFNPLQNIVKKQYGNDWFVQKPHINYFTKKSAIELLQKCGYTIIDISGTFPIEIFYLMGIKYIGNDVLGRRCHKARLKLEKTVGYNIYNFYKLLYTKFGVGRESIITAEMIY